MRTSAFRQQRAYLLLTLRMSRHVRNAMRRVCCSAQRSESRNRAGERLCSPPGWVEAHAAEARNDVNEVNVPMILFWTCKQQSRLIRQLTEIRQIAIHSIMSLK